MDLTTFIKSSTLSRYHVHKEFPTININKCFPYNTTDTGIIPNVAIRLPLTVLGHKLSQANTLMSYYSRPITMNNTIRGQKQVPLSLGFKLLCFQSGLTMGDTSSLTRLT